MVAAKKSSSNYEASRQKTIDENKKRMKELNLNILSKALLVPPPKPAMKKKVKKAPKQSLDEYPLRRSSRVADLPPPVYTEVPVEPTEKPRSNNNKGRDLLSRVYADDEDRQSAIQRAEDLLSSLDQDIPRFIKPMLQSHVTGGFWLGLPVKFCRDHLPNHDVIINLIDETGKQYSTRYLPRKRGLSGGWMGFSVCHNLVDGDALVFQLIEPTTFKVYIIRVNKPGDSDN